MHQELTESGLIAELLAKQGPTHLYHYTGPAGAVGILGSAQIWAGRPADMNDATEQSLAGHLALEMLAHLDFPRLSFGEGMVEYAVEFLSDPWRSVVKTSRVFTVSLTSEKDSLEQWRAYCPRSGGVSLGFPINHLRNVAADQGYLLVPCLYDVEEQRSIVAYILGFHLRVWDQRRPLKSRREGISSHLVRAFIADIYRFAPLLKHPSFKAEHEWRLISPLAGEGVHSETIHAPSETGIKLFKSFSLLTEQHPEIPLGTGPSDLGFHTVIGPNTNPDGMEEALHSLIPPAFGWQYVFPRTDSPYR